LRAVREAELRVARAEAAGDPLNEESSVGFDENGHVVFGQIAKHEQVFPGDVPLEMRVEHLLKLFEALLRGQPQILFECRHIDPASYAARHAGPASGGQT